MRTEDDLRAAFIALERHAPDAARVLPGVSGERRARKSRRTRLVLAGAVAVTAVAVTAVTLTIGSAPPAVATVTSALTRTLAQSYHFGDQGGSYNIRNGQITDRAHYTCTSEIDPVRQLAATSCSVGGVDREVGGYTYLSIVDPVGHPGKHWERVPTAPLGLWLPAINGYSTATPQQILSEIEQIGKVTVVGPASGPGWTGTRYAFSASRGSRRVISGTVDVDQQGRARSLVVTARSTSEVNVSVVTQVLTFSDFGERVTVTPPPADQTFPQP
jgi:hypothetical protein